MPEHSLERGLNWLLAQQSSDGCWRTDAFGQLKEGNASTALVLDTLTQLPESYWPRVRGACRKGIDFLRPRLAAFVTSPFTSTPRIEFPIYTVALFLSATQHRFPDEHRELKRDLTSLLLKQQRIVTNGWKETRDDLGGWGAWLERAEDPGAVESANVSCTRMAMQALSLSEAIDSEVVINAQGFLQRCRPESATEATGSGFFFTPDEKSMLNKKGTASSDNGAEQAVPYLSPTCDGILSLILLGAGVESAEIQKLLRVAGSMSLDVPPIPPIPDDTPPSAAASVFYYGAAALGALWKRTQSPELSRIRSQYLELLQKRQLENGSWENPLPWFQENAPLIATALALQAQSLLLFSTE